MPDGGLDIGGARLRRAQIKALKERLPLLSSQDRDLGSTESRPTDATNHPAITLTYRIVATAGIPSTKGALVRFSSAIALAR